MSTTLLLLMILASLLIASFIDYQRIRKSELTDGVRPSFNFMNILIMATVALGVMVVIALLVDKGSCEDPVKYMKVGNPSF